ncbi:hypothetical protein, partial [Collimonas sp. OK607]|uniref:hypothetical protein n=1 Tax=Collimonas sp. OK607 TaxID=1798194 RepID=UPI001B8B8DC5
SAALPSNAHTYRLLIVKEPSTSRHQNPGSRRCQIVLFVSSREMRLCGVSRFSSTTFLLLTEKLFTAHTNFNPLYFPQTSLPKTAFLPLSCFVYFASFSTGGEL